MSVSISWGICHWVSPVEMIPCQIQCPRQWSDKGQTPPDCRCCQPHGPECQISLHSDAQPENGVTWYAHVCIKHIPILYYSQKCLGKYYKCMAEVIKAWGGKLEFRGGKWNTAVTDTSGQDILWWTDKAFLGCLLTGSWQRWWSSHNCQSPTHNPASFVWF